jgi:hypothetical protein
MEGRENDAERYRKIIRRAKQVRERAAESLKRSRASRKGQKDTKEQADPLSKAAKARRRD